MAIPGLNIPGTRVVGAGAPGGGRPRPDLEIDVMDPGDARPSVLSIGNSGTGKTEQLARLMRAGYTALILDVENKAQILAAYRPLRINIGAPIKDGGGIRPADVTTKYDRLMRFRDSLREGKYREHNGKPIDFIGVDGLMEVGAVIKGHKFKNLPTSSKTGEQNTFRAFDEIGVDIIDFVASCKEAASDASAAFGVPPIGIVATCGEFWKDGEFRPLLPGNQAALMLKYQFELVLRLDVITDGGGLRYVAHTIPGEAYSPVQGRWYAKSPGGLFDPQIEDPDLGVIYKKMVDYYTSRGTEDKA